MAVGFSTPQLLDSWTAVSREQSENVYENKGTAKNIHHPYPHLIQGGEFVAPLLG